MVKKILKKCRTMFFTFLAKRQLKQYGRNLTVNHYCRLQGIYVWEIIVISME